MPEDIGYALAWQAELDAQCSGCGQPRDESMRPDNERGYVSTPVRCHACAEQAKTQKAWANSSGDAEGLYFTVQRQSRVL